MCRVGVRRVHLASLWEDKLLMDSDQSASSSFRTSKALLNLTLNQPLDNFIRIPRLIFISYPEIHGIKYQSLAVF